MSEFLADVAEVGDVLELRGPIGRWFVWDTRTPVLCLVGGTGVVPAVAMARTARRLGSTDLLRIAAMARDRDTLAYAPELERFGATTAYTRAEVGDRPPGPFTVEEVTPMLEGVELGYVCGSARFAAYAEELLVSVRHGSRGDPRRALRAHGRLRPPGPATRSAAGPGAHDVSTRAATRQSIPPDRTPGSTVQPGGRCKTGEQRRDLDPGGNGRAAALFPSAP